MVFGGENAESYYDEGITASMKGNLKRAAQHFQRVLELDGAYLAAYHQLGRCYLRMGDGATAVQFLQRVVERKPRQVPPRIDLGHALLNQNDVQRARAQFSEILGADPLNGRALLGLALCAYSENDWAAAVRYAQTSRDNGGQAFAALLLLGRAAKLAGQPEVARENLEQADKLIEKSVELTTDQPESYYLRGEVAYAQGNEAAALEHYRGAEDRANRDMFYSVFGENFTYADVLAKQGLCYQSLGKNDRAHEMGERIMKIDPQHRVGRMLASL
jgi:tetratricopeptide (TPR) repeat protein